MPEMDGLTLLSRLGESNPLIKSVIVSAYGDMENIRTAMNRGAFDFITKPINFEDLQVTMEKTLKHVLHIKDTLKAIKENNILKMYVDETVLNFMGSREYESSLMENETLEATVMFVDICSFTSISETTSADILLTTRDAIPGWHYSQISLGYVPSLIALSLQPYDMQASVSVAQLARAYTLAGNDVHTLPPDTNVASLLRAKRYDVIVDESRGVFQHDIKSQLHRHNLYPGRPIRLATTTPALKAALEQGVRQQNVQGIKLLDESVRAISVQLIAKSFNPDKYLLQESAEDLGFMSLLQQKLAQYHKKKPAGV